MFLRSIWQRFRPGPRESVELGPADQLALGLLLRFGARSADDVRKEVTASRPAAAGDVDEALARLESFGLVTSRMALEGDQSQTFYAPTRKAARLKNHLPTEPQTVMEFYL